MAIAVIFRTLAAVFCALIAYAFTELSQPRLCPGEFHAENRKADRYNHDGRAGRHYHHDTDGEHGATNRQYRDSSRHFVGNSGCVLHRSKRTT